MSHDDRVRVGFQLSPDADGYPPFDFEWLWCRSLGQGTFVIDNIPFFVPSIAVEDHVMASTRADGQLLFLRLLKSSGHSTLRILLSSEDLVQQVRNELRDKGCGTEVSHLPRLLAVDVPATADLNAIRRWLAAGETKSLWEYEESCLAKRLS